LIAPLDIASARGPAKQLITFDNVREVYKPVDKRRWGYYNLPVLYGDRLVAILDPRLDRKTQSLSILGLWLDDPALARDEGFRQALIRGLRRFARMIGAHTVDVSRAQALPGLRVEIADAA
jgi:uncharacterized protein YcaQ